MARWLSLLLLLGLNAQSAYPQAEFGPLLHHFELTLDAGERTEAVGPLFSFEKSDTRRTWTFSPLLSYEIDPSIDSREVEVLYPLLTGHHFGPEFRYHLFQVISWSGGQTMDEEKKSRITLFPFYFQQRSSNPEQNYTALFPIYGTLRNRVFRDEAKFVLFPAYLKSRKRDVVTQNYLFPIFHIREGNNLKGWQVWPVIGYEQKKIGTTTNSFDEVELSPGHEKFFFAWPIFFHNSIGLGSTNPVNQYVFVPLFSVQRSPMRDSTTFPWPIGFTFTEDREKKYKEWDFPWPFIVVARGEGKTANRVWPFFSHARTPTLQSDFVLWPVYKRNLVTADPLRRERTRILFFLYSDLTEENTAAGTALRRTDLWPLFTARKDHAGRERLQLLAPLEPLLPNSKSVERLYSPLWSVWRSEKDPKAGAKSQSLLWNLYRRDERPESRKVSLLFGLFRYQSGPTGKEWRIFYLPVGRKSAATRSP